MQKAHDSMLNYSFFFRINPLYFFQSQEHIIFLKKCDSISAASGPSLGSTGGGTRGEGGESPTTVLNAPGIKFLLKTGSLFVLLQPF